MIIYRPTVCIHESMRKVFIKQISCCDTIMVINAHQPYKKKRYTQIHITPYFDTYDG